MKTHVDVLLIRGDTTLGLKAGDDTLTSALRRLGCSVSEMTPDYRVTRLLRATRLSAHLGVAPDLAESLDARRTTTDGLTRIEPRCIIYSPGFTSLLQPRARLNVPTAIRFDSPPSMSRSGRFGAPALRRLERRAFLDATLLLPWGVEPSPALRAALPDNAEVVPLPIPVLSGDQVDERVSRAVTYASSNPYKKGLDIVLGAWKRAAPNGMRLAIAGIDPAQGLRWCQRRRINVPETIDWVGRLPPASWRHLLHTSLLYVAASRYEDHGIAQLEALAQGALLITVPSQGPFEPLSLARKLSGELVAEAIDAEALAEVLLRVPGLSAAAAGRYRESAMRMTAAYSEDTLDDRLRTQVLPRLLLQASPDARR